VRGAPTFIFSRKEKREREEKKPNTHTHTEKKIEESGKKK
jgi:hypothetical protein